MTQDLFMIGYAWMTTFVWQWLAVPWLVNRFKSHSFTGGWAFGRVFTWLAISLVIWFTAHAGLPTNTPGVIWLVTLVFAMLSWKEFKAHRTELLVWLKQQRAAILCQELLFVIGFFGLALIRTYQPAILDLEKFMDAGLMISYQRSPLLPLQDFWLSGKNFNYYTFGHFMGAVTSQFWGIEIRYAYNILLGLICGLVLMQSFAIVVDLVAGGALAIQSDRAKTSLKAGFIGALIVGLGGNGHTLWFWLKNHTFLGYWYPDATRFIDRTIHEFPAYSFIVSDLHAHVWGIPLVLLLVWVIWQWAKAWQTLTTEQQSWFGWWGEPITHLVLAIGVLLGTLIMTSTWDFAIYGLLLGWVGFGLLAGNWKRIGAMAAMAACIGGLAFITSSPWWLHFESISQGVQIAYEHSPLWQLAVLWLPHVLLSSLAVWFAIREWRVIPQAAKSKAPAKVVALQQATLLMIVALVITAICLLVLPELIFVKDIYPNHPRANTMFKLTFQGFIMMGLAIGWLYGQVLTWFESKAERPASKSQRLGRLGIVALLLIFLSAVGIYPYFGFRDYYGGLKQSQGLDGMIWLQTGSPDDFQAIQWLKQITIGRPVVLEAVGESYTEFGRVSVFTGLPTVLGWRVHEWLWRGGFEIPGQRTEEVKTIYERPGTPEAQTLLSQYQVRYIFVGDREREAYPDLDLAGLEALGQVVFRSNQTEVIAIP
jgi:uncharacterized membrane protein